MHYQHTIFELHSRIIENFTKDKADNEKWVRRAVTSRRRRL